MFSIRHCIQLLQKAGRFIAEKRSSKGSRCKKAGNKNHVLLGKPIRFREVWPSRRLSQQAAPEWMQGGLHTNIARNVTRLRSIWVVMLVVSGPWLDTRLVDSVYA